MCVLHLDQHCIPQLPASFDLAVGESRVAVQLAHILYHHFDILYVCIIPPYMCYPVVSSSSLLLRF